MSTPVHVARSRTYPVARSDAFDVTGPVELSRLMRRRYGPLPPIREVRDQTGGGWVSEVGQTRTVVLADGGTMRETLLSIDPPASFGYELSQVTGPMRPLVRRIEGRWGFEEAGTGTRVTWEWTLHPTFELTRPAVAIVARLWRGYARQVLEELEPLLVEG